MLADMDTSSKFAIALAEEEDLVDQIEALSARLAAIRRIKEQNKPTAVVSLDDPFSKTPAQPIKPRKPAIVAAVLSMLRESENPVPTKDLVAGLAVRGLVDAADKTDSGYARATIQRMKKDIEFTPDGWKLRS